MFQIHLWAGIGVGIYLLLVCLSGSVIIFQIELQRLFNRPPVVLEPSGPLLTDEQLKAAALQKYPAWDVSKVWRQKNPNQAVEVWFDRNKAHMRRIFNPYTGVDLGASVPAGSRFVLWLIDLHDNLLYEDTGRRINGAGAILLTVLCITGAIIWWPGAASWRRSLIAPWTGNWKRFNWGIHSVIGFWTFAFVTIWGISGIYLVWPEPFTAAADYLQPAVDTRAWRWADDLLSWVAKLHFGRFAGWPVKTLWFILGFAPLVLFVTGAIMWWNRVVRPARDAISEE
jgi:uncharacterized iron-regulated membrane protein